MEILLVRHGESLDGAEVRVQRAKSPLTPRGEEQARRARAELSRRHPRFDRIWTSDLARAAETAEILARGLEARVTRRAAFREIELGPWEGRLLFEIESSDGAALARWRSDARRPPRRGVEPIGRLLRRLLRGIREVSARGRGPIVVVTHGGAISVLLTHLLGIGLRTIWQVPVEHGSISRLLREGDRFYVSSVNETGHLTPRRRPPTRAPRSPRRLRRRSRR